MSRSERDAADPFAGTSYRALRRLKSRPMTEIYEVNAGGHRCLAKILRSEHVSDPQIVDRMRLEAEILQAIDHPNVVGLIGHGVTAERRPFIVLEALVGRTLRRELVQRGALPVLEAVDLVLQALDGIAVVHDLGVVHRDLKPDNLFVCRADENTHALKIIDFGFAKVVRGAKRTLAPLLISTEDRQFVGSARFAAPEQIRLGGNVDHRTDLYTLGLVLYTVVLGREPHHDLDNRTELLRAHLEGRLPSPSADTAERVSKELIEIIWRATKKSPSERFADARAFARALQTFVAGRTKLKTTDGSPKAVMTIDLHAQLTAATESDPGRAAELREQFGISSARQLRAVERWWGQHIGSNPKVHAHWRALVERYKRRHMSPDRDN